jgi:hypothetical protein
VLDAELFEFGEEFVVVLDDFVRGFQR